MRVLLICLALVASCKKDDGTGRGTSGGESGELSRDAVVAAWKKGGLTPSAMTDAKVEVGKDCQTGTVNGVDVLVCQFPTPADAKAAEDAGLKWVGEATGMSQSHGKVLVAASDRRKADPSGRTINSLMKLSK
jgi:hypothetical protein